MTLAISENLAGQEITEDETHDITATSVYNPVQL